MGLYRGTLELAQMDPTDHLRGICTTLEPILHEIQFIRRCINELDVTSAKLLERNFQRCDVWKQSEYHKAGMMAAALELNPALHTDSANSQWGELLFLCSFLHYRLHCSLANTLAV